MSAPPSADEAFARAATAYGQRDLATAERLARAILVQHPTHYDALNLAGIAAAQANRPAEAEPLLARAVAARPELAVAHNNHANVLRALGRHDAAVAGYDQAIRLEPRDALAWCNRGGALRALGRDELALDSYARAIALRADYVEAHYSRAVILHALGRIEEAIAGYERAIALASGFADAHYNLGNALLALRRHDAALAAYDAAIALVPGAAEAHNNRGTALLELGRPDDALASFTRATSANPALADAYYNRGNALTDLARPTEALADYARALAVNPSLPWVRGAWLHTALSLADWSALDPAITALEADIRTGRPAAKPLTVLAVRDDPALQQRAASIWAASVAVEPLAPIAPRAGGGRIRIGYYSADLHEHATAYLMAELFELHDRARFEVTAFSFGPERVDPMRRRLTAAFEHFIDVRGRTDREIALLSRERGIDIAVDLKGFTRDSRPGIFAHRAAPVQVGYVGYPGTLGSPLLDYLVVDDVLVPAAERSHYSERLIRLPRCYQPNDRVRPIAAVTPRRADVGLPDAGTVYCCFNATFKLLPATFDAWMRILSQVPGSVLWLYAENNTVRANLEREAARRGIAPARLVFAPPLPLAEHLARYRLADLFLDTLPCSAHTTASDALWAGLPVLTRTGRAFAARVAASLVRAAGLPELVVASAQEYELLAVALGRDPARLATLRGRLAASRDSLALFDTPALVGVLESAYATIHARLLAGDPPVDLDVTAS
jgi:predicted O-linked N-acetylglucosamine transferase (SPINDLY family)